MSSENQHFPIRPQAISTCGKCKKSFSHLADEKTRDCMDCMFKESEKRELTGAVK